ncbi:MAG: N-acyl homoserine lactonase family protein, partial [Pseudomonadota bacterium]
MSWEVYAVKYADRPGRTRADSFIFDDNHDAPHAIDYYMWVLRREGETILVDTGYDAEEGALRT